MLNQLVTRGMSTTDTQLLVTRGFSVSRVIQEVVEASNKLLRFGRSSARHAYDQVEEVLVFARLNSVNKKVPTELVQGSIRITYDKLRRFSVSAIKTGYAILKSRLDEIVIVIKRIR